MTTPRDLAHRLLTIQSLYARYEEDEATLSGLGMVPEQSRDDLADEYAATLRQLLEG